MAEELVFLKDNEVMVTDSRFVVGNQTFAIANITSVRCDEIGIGCVAVIGFIAGSCLLNSAETAGIFLSILAIIIYFSREHSVILVTAGSETKAFKSSDMNRVKKVADAINKAIVSRR